MFAPEFQVKSIQCLAFCSNLKKSFFISFTFNILFIIFLVRISKIIWSFAILIFILFLALKRNANSLKGIKMSQRMDLYKIWLFSNSNHVPFRSETNKNGNAYVQLLFAEWRDLISSWYRWNRFEFFVSPNEFHRKKLISILLSMHEHVCPNVHIRLFT